MSLDMPIMDSGLVRLSPLDYSYTFIFLGTPRSYFYRIFGSAGDFTLAYISRLIKNPEEARRMGYKRVFGDFDKNLDRCIETMCKEPIPNEHPLDQNYERRETLKNYFLRQGQQLEVPEIRRLLQSYKTLVNNLYNGLLFWAVILYFLPLPLWTKMPLGCSFR